MSLINRMLLDLDARSSDGAATSAIHGEVRAVPERRAVHVAWWITLVLAVLLIAVVLVWFTHKEQPARLPSDLSLRIAPDLALAPLPTLPKPVEPPNRPAELPVPIETQPATKAAANQIKEAALPANPPAPATVIPPVAAAPTKAADPAPVTVTLSKQIKELSPQQRAENQYRKAASLIQQGRAAEAIDMLEQLLQFDPLHAAARQTLVGLLLESKRQDDAMHKMREGLTIEPNQPGLAMILARQQVEKGELSPAVETLQKTLPYALERADYQAFLAALLQRQSNHGEAAEHYLLALRQAPQNGVWWMGLGISLQAENRLPEAQEAFGKAKASNSLTAELLAFVEQRLTQLKR